MKKDRKKKKKTVNEKKSEPNGTRESLTDSLESEEGGTGGGDGRGGEKMGAQIIEERCESQETRAQNDEKKVNPKEQRTQ